MVSISNRRKSGKKKDYGKLVKILNDVRKSGKKRDWARFKKGTLALADTYERLGDKARAKRCRGCGTYLGFAECPSGHERKLISMISCQLRLCPMCAPRRSDLIFKNLREVIHTVKEREKCEFLFLTLTAKTVKGDVLKDELTKYFKAWTKLTKRRPFKASVVGWVRCLEITHNWKKGTYHPHFHCLLMVRPSYFGKGYIKQATWAQWWKESMELDYIPITDVRKVKPRKENNEEISEINAILETGKYTVKSSDYLIPENLKAQDEAVQVLDDALRNRRLLAYGGILNDIRKELKHVDEEKANLVKVGEDDKEGCNCSVCNAVYEEVQYKWHHGYKQYVEIGRNGEEHYYIGSKGELVDKETGEIIGVDVEVDEDHPF